MQCTHVCMSICVMYAFVRVCVCVHVLVCRHSGKNHLPGYMHAYIHVYVCVCVGVCRHGGKDHLPGYMYAYMCVCVCAHVW